MTKEEIYRYNKCIHDCSYTCRACRIINTVAIATYQVTLITNLPMISIPTATHIATKCTATTSVTASIMVSVVRAGRERNQPISHAIQLRIPYRQPRLYMLEAKAINEQIGRLNEIETQLDEKDKCLKNKESQIHKREEQTNRTAGTEIPNTAKCCIEITLVTQMEREMLEIKEENRPLKIQVLSDSYHNNNSAIITKKLWLLQQYWLCSAKLCRSWQWITTPPNGTVNQCNPNKPACDNYADPQLSSREHRLCHKQLGSSLHRPQAVKKMTRKKYTHPYINFDPYPPPRMDFIEEESSSDKESVCTCSTHLEGSAQTSGNNKDGDGDRHFFLKFANIL